MKSSRMKAGGDLEGQLTPVASTDDVEFEWSAPPEQKVDEETTGDRSRDRHLSTRLNNATPQEMPQEKPAAKNSKWNLDTSTREGNTNDQLHNGKYTMSFAVKQKWLNQGHTIQDLGDDVMTPSLDMPEKFMAKFRRFYEQHEEKHPESRNTKDEATGVEKNRYHSGLYHAGTQMKHPDPRLGGLPLADTLDALKVGDRVQFSARYKRTRSERQRQQELKRGRKFVVVESIRYVDDNQDKGYIGLEGGQGFKFSEAVKYLDWYPQENYDYELGAEVRDMMDNFVDSEHCPFDRHVTRTEDQGVQKRKRLVDFRFIHNYSGVEAQKWHVDYGRGSGSVIFFITLTPAFETFCTEYVSNRCRRDRNGKPSWVATTPIEANKMVIMSPGAIHRRGPDRQPEADRERIFFSCGYIDEDKMHGKDGAMQSDAFNPAKKQFSYIDDFTQPHPIKTAFAILDSVNAMEDMAEGWSAYEPEVPALVRQTMVEELEKVAQLKRSGEIDEEEFANRKNAIFETRGLNPHVMCIKRTEETSDQEKLREALEQGKLSFEVYCEMMNPPRFHRSRSESV